MANIKFYRTTEWNPQVTPLEGYVWFNPTNKTISLYKNSKWEVYTNLVDATYSDNILEITKSDESKISIPLNFASASDFNTLSQNLGALQTSFSALSGEFSDVKTTVGTHTTAIATVVKKLQSIAEEEEAVKKYVDNKMSEHETIRETIDDGFESRISGLETTSGQHTSAINTLNSLVGSTAVSTQITNAIDALDNGGVTGNGTFVDVTVTQVDGKVTGVSVAESNIASASDLADVGDAVNNEITRATNAEAAIAARLNSGGDIASAIAAAQAAAQAAQADIDAWNSATEDTDGVIETITELNTYITEHTNAFIGLSQRVGTNETAISTLNDKVDVAKVSTAISEAKTQAINAAASDATTKANNAKSSAVSEANGYTDTQVSDLAGDVNTNTTDIATIKGDITTINGQIETINTTIEENELTVSSALNALDTRINALSSSTVSSVTGQNYITASTTDGAVVVMATTGSVASGANALALASDVKTYVDSAWTWGEF